MILETIKTPKDIKKLNKNQLEELSTEIRNVIKETVEQNGGHLSSNLGVVELTIALHRSFNMPEDKIIFDVGHQAYTHKLLTGRYPKFKTLRKYKGISGFPRCDESIYDTFEVGHASTSISASLGMARSRDLKNKNYNIIAVVGDGALTGGMCYEALNDAGNEKTNLIVVLNDNEMSISHNVGALSSYFSKLRTSKSYRNVKISVKSKIYKLPFFGKAFYSILHFFKTLLKKLLLKENFFTPLGFHYLGPIDGHNIEEMQKVFERAQNYKEPVLIHCCTKKGSGDEGCECEPISTHGIAPKQLSDSKNSVISSGKIVATTLFELMKKDSSIVVVTAAMETGTGTSIIKQHFPNRFFDVGIAEEHAVTMCAGMAKAGLKPFFFVYSTFFQRCFDQLVHDVYLQNLPVVFCLDRCGIAGEDGITHNGIYDLGMSQTLPGVNVFSPYSAQELSNIVEQCANINAPTIIRYGKNIADVHTNSTTEQWRYLTQQNSQFAILSYGFILNEVLLANNLLLNSGIKCSVINASTIEPLDFDMLKDLSTTQKTIFVVEEHMQYNGLSSKLAFEKEKNQFNFKLEFIGIHNKDIQHGERTLLLKEIGLDSQSLYENIKEKIKNYEK